jgi:hypothetical protein
MGAHMDPARVGAGELASFLATGLFLGLSDRGARVVARGVGTA